jgi:hypothetical protein
VSGVSMRAIYRAQAVGSRDDERVWRWIQEEHVVDLDEIWREEL